MTGESLNIIQNHLEKLKQLFPETVTEGKIDWEKLQATLGKENIEFRNERYVLNWAGKSEAFKVLQQATTATLKPIPEESINFDTTENVFIEGENLEVLKVLQKAYYGKVKCIIIDPPYNTGNDSFIYPDSFKESKEDYQKRIGEKDEEGYLLKEGFFRKNSKDSGHYHSNWLNMMYPRLFLAKNLLHDEGVIFVHIDDNEVHNLRLIMNEIFGEENNIGTIVRATGTTTGQGGGSIGKSFDYILVYSKQVDYEVGGIQLSEKDHLRYNLEDENGKFSILQLRRTGSQDRREDRPKMYYALNSPDGKKVFPIGPTGYESRWRVGQDRYKKMAEEDLIYWKKNEENEWVCYFKYYLEGRTKRPSNLWTDVEGNKKAQVEIKELFKSKVFDTPKPTDLIKKCLQISTSSDETAIVLDFFGGSASTAHAVLDKNFEDGGSRKFILVQLPELCDKSTEAFKAGYRTIADIAADRIRKVIAKIQKQKNEKPDLFEDGSLDLGFKVFKLSPSNFKIWRGSEITEENLEKQLDVFTNPVKEGSETENMLYELILKAGYLLTDKVEVKDKYYSVNDGELIIALEDMNKKLIDSIISAKPKKVITLDKLFTGNDQLKTNSVLQMRDAEIDFKTI